MKNYIQILGKRIKLTDEQVNEIKKGIADDKVTLGSIPEGETCKIGDYEFIVLNHNTDSSEILLKGLLHEEEKFASDNNFDGSSVDKLCETFYKVLARVVGKDSFVKHTVDLTSDDGLKHYGKVRRMMSLLTTEQYRQYVDILDEYNPEKWWWLATPHSAPRHGNSSWVKCVSPFGDICSSRCGHINGVRPFCILKSDILISK